MDLENFGHHPVSFYVTRPNNPDPIAGRSREFFLAESRFSENNLAQAEQLLADIQNQYDLQETNASWESERRLARAEESYEAAERCHHFNLLRVHWETDGKWKAVNKPAKGAMPAPWADDPSRWIRFFRHNNPLDQK